MDWRNRCCPPFSASIPRCICLISRKKRKETAMRSNGLLKWLMIPVALLVLFAGIRLLSGSDTPRSGAAGSGSQLTPEEMLALGIEGDTPNDTVATLVAQVKQLRTELQTAQADNKTQRSENVRLRQRETAIDQRISSALESERASLRRDQAQLANERQQSEGLLQDLQRRLESLGNTDLPVGLGLREGDADGLGADAGIRWVEPDDAQQDDGRNRSSSLSFPTRFGPAQKTLETTAGRVANAGAKAAGVSTAKAVYTVPTNSTLRSEEHTSELQSLMRISYAVFCLKKKTKTNM